MISSNITAKNGTTPLLLIFFALLAFCLLVSLGIWQLQRAQQKRALLQAYAARSQQAPLTASDLNPTADLRYYRAKLEGTFENQHTFLLDNRTYQGHIGYEIYTPFKIKGLNKIILVNRGWLPASSSRAELPTIPAATQTMSITGILNNPAAHFSLGSFADSNANRWPLRIEFIDLQILSKLLGYPVFPYILWLDSSSKGSFTPAQQVTTISPEKHIAYAIQWFALAIGLLIVCVALIKGRR